MKAMNPLSAISYSEPPQDLHADDARIVLLITADSAMGHRLIRALHANGHSPRAEGEAVCRVLPIATSIAQAHTSVGRAAPDVILLDECVGAPNLFTHVVQDLANIAPVILLAAAENLARWCARKDSSMLVAQGRVECVARQGEFVPLAARLIERHAFAREESSGEGRSVTLAAVADRSVLDAEDVPLDFGEVLRHEVNNPLTGILGNAELLLSRRDRLSPDMTERLEIIAELAIRLRETVRRLSNALERGAARVPEEPSADLSHRHRPPT